MSEPLECETPVAVADDGKLSCCLCNARVHSIQGHLMRDGVHGNMTIADYVAQFPDEPVLSVKAQELQAKREAGKAMENPLETKDVDGYGVTKQHMHDVFKLGPVKAAMSFKGSPIPIAVMKPPSELEVYVPDIDDGYIFNIEMLKTVLLGLEGRYPTYLWGHAGTGKTTIFEQVCAYTKRPMIRVQHTRNTEESHVVGQWTVKDGQTVFELGPLPYAMKYGLTYLADEYDFAMPAVTALYQPVLEGKPLVIKEADLANRIVKPHPMFRFVATGNTNGTGDETGLYAGTLIQNAANYERFAIVDEVKYPEEKIEIGILMSQGGVTKEHATQMVKFGNMVREAFIAGKIGLPVSPRALINSCKMALRRGSFRTGVTLSYVNRLGRVDQEAVRELIDRCGLE
jgi:cobaltochelatase CobS